jgi:xanthine dehydrogenase small subunit
MTKHNFILNAEEMSVETFPTKLLADYLRYDEKLPGTKIVCKEGDCGACTVIVGEYDNNQIKYQTITSCITSMQNIDRTQVITIEGINLENELNLIQEEFAENNASQCGFCTPGFIMSLAGYLLTIEVVDLDSALTSLDGNICRCTGYSSIIRSTEGLVSKLLDLGINNTKLGEERISFLVKNKIVSQHIEVGLSKLKLIIKDETQDAKSSIKNYFKLLDTETVVDPIIIAGGTDLNVQIPDKLYSMDPFFIKSKNLSFIREEPDKIVIGLGTTFAELLESDLITKSFPNLIQSMRLISSTQIRNQATLGGNMVNASPIADMVIYLLPFDPLITLISSNDEREILLKDLYLDYKKLDKTDDEILYSLSISSDKFEGGLHNFEKVSKRTILDIASVNSAIYLKTQEMKITEIGLSVGGVAPIPKFMNNTCDYLMNKEVSVDLVKSALDIFNAEIVPISDIRGSKEYKRLLARNLFFSHFIELFPIIQFEELIA